MAFPSQEDKAQDSFFVTVVDSDITSSQEKVLQSQIELDHVTDESQQYQCKPAEEPSTLSNTEERKGKTVRVCKEFFMATFAINSARIDGALKKKTQCDFRDKRGRASSANKIPSDDIALVEEHINFFPRYMSHYCREQTKREYLQGVKSVSEMYALYVDFCCTKVAQPVSEYIYRRIFDYNFNLSFKMPQSDTCKKCDIFKMKLSTLTDSEERATVEKERNHHQMEAQQVREQLNANIQSSRQESSRVKVISFDLQKTKSTPSLNTNEVYYKRQLNVYTCGIHDCTKEIGYFLSWHEGTASRGAQEIASCLYTWFHKYVQNDIPERIIAYADSCGGQNRNIIVVLMWLFLVHKYNLAVEIHFMVSGHSYLPSDRDFGIDERAKRKYEQVYIIVNGWR